jgi:hypothetical protein
MLSQVVIHGNSADSWKRTRRSRAGPLTGASLSVMLPLSGFSKPAKRRMSVVLPQPEGPIITVSLLRSSVKEQSLTTSVRSCASPYPLQTCSTRSSPGLMLERSALISPATALIAVAAMASRARRAGG